MKIKTINSIFLETKNINSSNHIFIELKHILYKNKIEFKYEEKDFHDRKIWADTGIHIEIGRGLHIYQKPNTSSYGQRII